ncbi:hypothetical protein [Streptomyces sp. NPDC051310]|uniref:hypothetical protein n=1 Tax=Streptomyces sp. NPDC051310 TaxID=3365649 RepID=UPI0037892998
MIPESEAWSAAPGPEGATARPEEARRLRGAFADAADGITPGPVPLAAVVRAGRARVRRRAAGLAVCCGLLVASLALVLHPLLAPEGEGSVVTPASPTASPSPAPSRPRTPSTSPAPPRVVAAGERVKAAPGVELWLTPEGKHWSTGDGGENFRSVVDGNLDMAQPGLSHQTEGSTDGLFHSGVYYGTRAAGRVVLTDAAGRTTTADLVKLPGEPGWGAWYATTPAAAGTGHGVTLYDRHGKALADLPGIDSPGPSGGGPSG